MKTLSYALIVASFTFIGSDALALDTDAAKTSHIGTQGTCNQQTGACTGTPPNCPAGTTQAGAPDYGHQACLDGSATCRITVLCVKDKKPPVSLF